ncbi:UDP-N-acetylmuramoylalanyl-D-glutamyl-2,6-diaminopimelate--D-alanyl-D-alanine ligase [Enterovirga sp.]|uniref:UDP-N-acetylmuramoylalanyl-D-glutamyl-2, 6-diaminopimelate--D-alanyl-D-alanine ligase n=1 Tax=Enterovirga sp. TaxID=2026350 RepID=UPI002609D189|nr:UDP-N-acetylmuramoylalanyl-D-glutamyl-2,6-diaminopimelate--D-alanyl-D-alanine ligase [Enterovirga sp.]MDB5592504.1 UDP-N-acetylmuramoylalanyl-D-glutamyl-2,6-diaminopimelate--D-alanyl-D-alanyl ligase [Enterovirga sp.]
MTTPPLWTPAEIAAVPGARLLGARAPATGISIDTRTLAPGDLFFAIRGVASDGHDHVRTALAAGAAAAVVAEERAADFANAGPLVVVPDVLEALRALGRAARARTAAGVVGVTGSVGKTGTKDALRLVLSGFGPTHAATASFNNHWGVPVTLARMPRETAFGVFEVGMNHPGEIVPLTAMVRPHVAVVTAVEPVHIAHFRSVSGIADAKGEIFSGLEPGGVAVIPSDNPHHGRLLAHAGASRAGRVVGFGEGAGADVRALRIAAGPDHSFVEADVLGRRVAYRIGMAGRHVALNSLAVLAVAHVLGLDIGQAASAYAGLVPPAGRGERIRLRAPSGEFLLIDESFNANPASMRAALAALALVELPAGGRRVAVLADMGELGEAGPAAHRELAEAVAAANVDVVFAAGPLIRDLWEALPPGLRGAYAESAAALQPAVLDAVRGGDAVMVKGSKSTLVSKIAATLASRFAPAAEPLSTAAART